MSKTLTMSHARLVCTLVAISVSTLVSSAWAGDTTGQEQLARWQAHASQPASAQRGQVFFSTEAGRQLSCASCHNVSPVTPGRHASTGKPIEPLAPIAHAPRLTQASKVDKWFARNCKDVLARECTAQEKADVLAYLLSFGAAASVTGSTKGLP